MWQFFKDFLFYHPSEKRAIVLLLTLIVLTIGASFWYERTHQPVLSYIDNAALQAFADTLHQKDGSLDNASVTDETVQLHLLPFDPNTADSLSLVQLGLRPFVVNNVLRYRAKGGVFRQASDFRKIYGLRDEEYDVLLPYIMIQKFDTQSPSNDLPIQKDSVRSTKESLLKESIYEKVEKYEIGTVVDLNKADTTELKKIPGIGSAIARMIVTYRSQLGGFYEVRQLRDINLDASQLQSWFSIDESDIRKMSINKSSADLLRRHPYINFYQAKAIVEHRRKHGTLTSLQPFVLYEEFTASDLERIGHYLSFE
ncbi:MAG: helix-hairpin-helix domain-containing protein [Bacteroidaceae bacterium]|nr:helix-hairpin-helix domain-containing protein [Bacteroidaceae bacterium]